MLWSLLVLIWSCDLDEYDTIWPIRYLEYVHPLWSINTCSLWSSEEYHCGLYMYCASRDLSFAIYSHYMYMYVFYTEYNHVDIFYAGQYWWSTGWDSEWCCDNPFMNAMSAIYLHMWLASHCTTHSNTHTHTQLVTCKHCRYTSDHCTFTQHPIVSYCKFHTSPICWRNFCWLGLEKCRAKFSSARLL